MMGYKLQDCPNLSTVKCWTKNTIQNKVSKQNIFATWTYQRNFINESQNQHKQNISNEQTALLDDENPVSSRDEELREIKCHVCLEKMDKNYPLLHESYLQDRFWESLPNKIHQLKHDRSI